MLMSVRRFFFYICIVPRHDAPMHAFRLACPPSPYPISTPFRSCSSLCIDGYTSSRTNVPPLLYRLCRIRPTFTDHYASYIEVIIQICFGSAITFYIIWFVYIRMDEMDDSRAAFSSRKSTFIMGSGRFFGGFSPS